MGTKTIGSGGDYATLAAYKTYIEGIGTFTEDHYAYIIGTVTDTASVTLAPTTGSFKCYILPQTGYEIGGRLYPDRALGRATLNTTLEYSTAYIFGSGVEVAGVQILQGSRYFNGLLRTLTGSRVRRCIIAGIDFRDNQRIVQNDIGGAAGKIEDCLIVGNVELYSGSSAANLNNCTVVGIVTCDYGGTEIRNTAIYGSISAGTWGGTSSNNRHSGTNSGTNTGSTGSLADSAITSPGVWTFGSTSSVDTAFPSADYRLPSGSVLVDAGASVAAGPDVYNNSRPQGGAYDIGAHELPVADTTPPTLTSPVGTGGTLACSGSVSTTEGNGTLYTSFTASATSPSAVQVEAGQDHTGSAALRAVSQPVSSSGSVAVASGSITAGPRYAHFMHKDAAGNRSAVASSAAFVVSSGSSTVSFSGSVSAQSGTAGSSFSWSGSALSAFFSGALTPFSYSVVSGALPPGLTINSSTGVVSGSPSAAGSYAATFRATDTGANTANSNSVTFTIAAASPPPPPPPPGTPALVLTGFKTWTGLPYASTLVNFVKVCRVSTGATVLELTGQSINASGAMTIADASLVASADYMVFGFNADGSLSFKKKVTAA